jgi:tetratricopeptide (TPR) repeat protein
VRGWGHPAADTARPPTQRLDSFEKYLEKNTERSFIDAWITVGYAQLELGLREEAFNTLRKILEISPKMIGLFRREIDENQLPREILE